VSVDFEAVFLELCSAVPVNADAGRAEIWGPPKQKSLNDQRCRPL
jgi:hypothetical protein